MIKINNYNIHDNKPMIERYLELLGRPLCLSVQYFPADSIHSQTQSSLLHEVKSSLNYVDRQVKSSLWARKGGEGGGGQSSLHTLRQGIEGWRERGREGGGWVEGRKEEGEDETERDRREGQVEDLS